MPSAVHTHPKPDTALRECLLCLADVLTCAATPPDLPGVKLPHGAAVIYPRLVGNAKQILERHAHTLAPQLTELMEMDSTTGVCIRCGATAQVEYARQEGMACPSCGRDTVVGKDAAISPLAVILPGRKTGRGREGNARDAVG